MVEINSETDFVAKNEQFLALLGETAQTLLNGNAKTVEEALALPCAEGTLNDAFVNAVATIGEKITLRRFEIVDKNDDEIFGSYTHQGGRITAVTVVKGTDDPQVAKNMAMQVASMNPVAISAEDCPAEVVENERKIAIEKTKEEQVQKAVDAALKKAGINPAHVDSEDHIESNTAKGWLTPEQAQQARQIIKTVGEEKAANLPEQMIQNIANGRVQKFFKEQTLEAQEYQMADNHISVKEALAAADKDAKIVAFKRFSFGD